jgi:UDP-glucose 4-epimerase
MRRFRQLQQFEVRASTARPSAAPRLVPRSPESLERVRTITGKPELVVEHPGDLLRPDEVDAVFAKFRFTGVIHFAGLKAVGESLELPLKYYENNLVGTINLLKSMERSKVGLLLFSSSATVYGEFAVPPVKESAPVGSGVTNPYGWTKLMLEQVIRDMAFANPWFQGVLLRYFNPVGSHSSGMIGEDPAGRPNNLMPFVLQVAIGRRDKLTVFGSDYPTRDGTAERDFVHVVDLAQGHLAALKAYVKGPLDVRVLSAEEVSKDEGDSLRCSVFNLGTGLSVSVKEVVTAMSEVLGRELPHEMGARRAGDIAVLFADPSRAERVLGWKAKLGLPEMVRDGWNWQQKNPYGFRTKEQAEASE